MVPAASGGLAGGATLGTGGAPSPLPPSGGSGGLQLGTGGTIASGGAGASMSGGAAGATGSGGKAAAFGGSAGSGGNSGAASAGGGRTGASGGSAGSMTGGKGGSGGNAGNAGTGGGSTQPSIKSCTNPTSGGVLEATMVVEAGKTYDGECRRFTAGSGLGDGSQDEDQKPMFRLEDGAKLVNVVLGGPAADGIHTYGDVTLENITWQDIGEDALTIKESGTVVLNGGSATNGDDKVFQINAASTFRVSNFKASNAGKFIRQNGDTTFKVEVFIDRCDISNMDESIFRTDSSSSTVTMTNTRYSNIGDALFLGVSPGNITESNNTRY